MQLDAITGRLAERRIALTLTDDAIDLLATLGYDPAFGARPLKRVLHKRILDPLAMRILDGSIQDGEHVVVSVRDGDLHFHAAMTGAPVVA